MDETKNRQDCNTPPPIWSHLNNKQHCSNEDKMQEHNKRICVAKGKRERSNKSTIQQKERSENTKSHSNRIRQGSNHHFINQEQLPKRFQGCKSNTFHFSNFSGFISSNGGIREQVFILNARGIIKRKLKITNQGRQPQVDQNKFGRQVCFPLIKHWVIKQSIIWGAQSWCFIFEDVHYHY